jgi:hypothetical protein
MYGTGTLRISGKNLLCEADLVLLCDVLPTPGAEVLEEGAAAHVLRDQKDLAPSVAILND